MRFILLSLRYRLSVDPSPLSLLSLCRLMFTISKKFEQKKRRFVGMHGDGWVYFLKEVPSECVRTGLTRTG